MADETPVKLKPKKRKRKTKKDVVLTCIVHCCNPTNSKISPLTETSFGTIKSACNIHRKHGSDPDTYGQIIEDMPDEFLKHVHGYRRSCYQKFTNVSRLLALLICPIII